VASGEVASDELRRRKKRNVGAEIGAEKSQRYPPRVSRSCVSGTGSLRRLPPRVQRRDRDATPHPGIFEKEAGFA
jgi:hypothetical protein